MKKSNLRRSKNIKTWKKAEVDQARKKTEMVGGERQDRKIREDEEDPPRGFYRDDEE